METATSPDADKADAYVVPQWRAGMPAVHRHAEIMSGTLVFVGTRVPLKNLYDYLVAGDPLIDFLEDFPGVSREHAVAALGESRQLLEDQARERPPVEVESA